MPMGNSRFTEEQNAHALRQADTGTPVTAVCRAMGVSEQVATPEQKYITWPE